MPVGLAILLVIPLLAGGHDYVLQVFTHALLLATLALAWNILGNDNTGTGETLSLYSYTQPQYGVLSNPGDGTLVYRPNANFNGNDRITSYNVCYTKLLRPVLPQKTA